MLLRLAYLGVTNALAMLRLLPMSDRAKDAEILALRHHITEIEADAELHAMVRRQVGVAALQCLLHGDSGPYGVHRAGKFRQHAVPGCAEYPPVMLDDQLGNDCPVEPERVKRALLVMCHHPAVTGNIGSEDSDKAALDTCFSHCAPLVQS